MKCVSKELLNVLVDDGYEYVHCTLEDTFVQYLLEQCTTLEIMG